MHSLITSEMMRREMAIALGVETARDIYWNDRDVVYDEVCWVAGAYPLKDPDLREVTVAYHGELCRFTYSTYWLALPLDELSDMIIRPVAGVIKSALGQKARLADA